MPKTAVKKIVRTCGICGESGHNSRTCTADLTPKKRTVKKPSSINPVGVDAVEFVSGDSGRTYQIARVMKRNKPIVACTCPGFSRYKHCKHSDAVIESGKMPKGERFVLLMENFEKRLVHNPKPAAAKVAKVTKPKVSASPKKPVGKRVMIGGIALPFGVPVNIKVAGERAMRKNVVLIRREDKPNTVFVKTGGRGRPANLDVTLIERFRAL